MLLAAEKRTWDVFFRLFIRTFRLFFHLTSRLNLHGHIFLSFRESVFLDTSALPLRKLLLLLLLWLLLWKQCLSLVYFLFFFFSFFYDYFWNDFVLGLTFDYRAFFCLGGILSFSYCFYLFLYLFSRPAVWPFPSLWHHTNAYDIILTHMTSYWCVWNHETPFMVKVLFVLNKKTKTKLGNSRFESTAPSRLADRKHRALSTQPNPHLRWWGFGWVDKARCFRLAKHFGAVGSNPNFSRVSALLASRHLSRNTLLMYSLVQWNWFSGVTGCMEWRLFMKMATDWQVPEVGDTRTPAA